jgi:hypothetical protein
MEFWKEVRQRVLTGQLSHCAATTDWVQASLRSLTLIHVRRRRSKDMPIADPISKTLAGSGTAGV